MPIRSSITFYVIIVFFISRSMKSKASVCIRIQMFQACYFMIFEALTIIKSEWHQQAPTRVAEAMNVIAICGLYSTVRYRNIPPVKRQVGKSGYVKKLLPEENFIYVIKVTSCFRHNKTVRFSGFRDDNVVLELTPQRPKTLIGKDKTDLVKLCPLCTWADNSHIWNCPGQWDNFI